MSETPRTENHCICGDNKALCVDCLFELSCKLETELAEALGEIKGLRQLVNDCHVIAGQLETERNEARAEIGRRDKLIEQMRKALEKVLYYTTQDYYREDEEHVRRANRAARVALAAERGEG